jgi:hypothetical protein
MNVPTSIVTDLYASTSALVGGTIPLITILFGISISFFFADKIIDMFPVHWGAYWKDK